MNNCVVTGGAGFIGSHLTNRLLEENRFQKIYIIDNLVRTKTTRNIDHILDGPRIEFLQRDISKFNFNYFDRKNISHIFHLASPRINFCAHYNRDGHRYIADGGFNIINYAGKNRIKLFFSSTASVYNRPKRLPIKEDDPTNPHTIYGAGKLYTEHLIRSYENMYGLNWTITRFFSIIGRRMDFESPYSEFLMRWMNNIKSGNNEIEVFGDPNQKVLDLVSVKNVVDAIVLTTFNSNREIFNVSTQKGYTLSEIIRIIEKVVGIKLNVKILPENRTDIEKKRIGDISKLKKLGWEPDISLEKEISDIWKWVKKLEIQK